MKKILRGPVKYRAKCEYCGCEFEYQHEDKVVSGDRYVYVTCLICKSLILHDENNRSCTSATLNNVDTMKL